MTPLSLKQQIQQDLRQSLKHLEYSYRKVMKIDLSKANWDEETLETLESFSSRFARSSDIFMSRYLRLLALEKDPGFQGTFIDLINFAEKAGDISSAKIWFRIRQLRNVAAHEYTNEDLAKLYKEVFDLAPYILEVQKNL